MSNSMADMVTEYRSSWVADILHSFPHFDIYFKPVNSSFNFHDHRYRESLLLWAALPVIWLLLTLLMFLFYFCYRCCQRDTEHHQNVSCLQWSMAVIVLLACGTVGVGFYGSEEMKRGAATVALAANDTTEVLGRMQQQVHKLEVTINDTISSGTKAISAYSNQLKISPTVRQDLIQQTKNTLNLAENVLDLYLVGSFGQKVNSATLREGVQLFVEYAKYRWIITTACLCWLTLLCLLLLLGIIRTSKCTLLMFCTLGIFSLVLCWIAAGVHLGTSVGTGDFCIDPHNVVEDLSSDYVRRETGILRYYVQCESVQIGKPFSSMLDKIKSANDTLNKAINMAHKHITQADYSEQLEAHVRRVYSGLGEATTCVHELAKCTDVHKDYSSALGGFCHTALFGMVLLALSFTATGLLFSILVVMGSRAWRSFGVSENEDAYPKPLTDVSEDEGPFLPRPGPSAPSYYRYGAAVSSPYGRPGSVHEDYIPYTRGNAQVHLALQRQANPPPPYSSTEFYHQYNDVVNPAMYGRYGGPPSVRESNA